MPVTQAVITAAGPAQRRLPLQTVTDTAGNPRTVLELLLEECRAAGIERVALVIHPGDGDLLRAAAGRHADLLALVEQAEPRGYGHAVACARAFVGNAPFLLLVSDHLYVSDDPARSCIRQLLDVAERERCAVFAVQPTHESQLAAFGAVGGTLFEGRPGLVSVERVLEKPTPTQAEEELLVPGMRQGHYLCFFGMHVLPPDVFAELDRLAAANPGARLQLTPALDALAARERALAVEIRGRRFDLDQRHGLLLAQVALALAGPLRAELLGSLVKLLAEDPRGAKA